MKKTKILLIITLISFLNLKAQETRFDTSFGYMKNTDLSISLSLKSYNKLGWYFASFGLGRVIPRGTSGVNYSSIDDSTNYSYEYDKEFYSMVFGTNYCLQNIVKKDFFRNLHLSGGLGWLTNIDVETVYRYHIWDSSSISNESSNSTYETNSETSIAGDLFLSYATNTNKTAFTIDLGVHSDLGAYYRIGFGFSF